MSKELSIIIPCYNCADTLEEAVDSVYRQNLTIPFEIVVVDDCSTDKTPQIMKGLAAEYPEVKLFYHEKNLGGGATRNTAVEKSIGQVIFCLDSDDILGDGTLAKMYHFLQEKKADAVGVSTSIKFRGKNINDVVFTNDFDYVGEIIPFESLFSSQKCSLYSVFMFTKQAFEITGGYPTGHGFDTQGFAWRFLANGLVAYTCPKTIYYHRISFHQSYYIREYESGKINHNWFKVFEEFLYLFKTEIRQKLLKADLNNPNLDLPDLTEGIDGLRPEYTKFIVPKTRENYENLIKGEKEVDLTDYYWLGSKKMANNNQIEALNYFTQVYKAGLRNDHLYDNLLKLSYPFTPEEEKLALKARQHLQAYQKKGSAVFLPLRICRKVKKVTISNFSKGWKIMKGQWQNSPNKIFFFSWLFLLARKKIHLGFQDDPKQADHQIIDIVIPTISKDHLLLETVLASLGNINHQINKIFIVSKDDDFIKDFCRRHNCIFIDERSVLGYGKEVIDYKVDGLDRSGWLFQQLLKLSGEKFVEQENYFVLDSDTVLLNPHSLIENGKFVFFENEEWNEPYFIAFKKMFGYPTKNRLSFTSHMMIFNTRYLKEMKIELEKKNMKSWDEIYRATTKINPQEQSCVSDYDTYANWLWLHHPDQIIRKPLYNRSLDKKELSSLNNLIKKYGKKYKSLSFHSYYLKSRQEIINETKN